MPFNRGTIFRILPLPALLLGALAAHAQSGNAGTVRGTVTDPSGAVIPNATVHLTNASADLTAPQPPMRPASSSSPTSLSTPIASSVSANGFAPRAKSFEIRSVVGTNLKLVLQIAGASQTVTVEAQGDLVENDPTFHTDVDRDLFIKVPLESQSSTLSSLVTLTTPGVAADSNGLFHGLGDHASNSFSVDGQSITDQQSKVFSNQLPSELDSIHRGHQRRAAGRVRRQDQPGDRGHNALRTGRHQAHRQHQQLLRRIRLGLGRLRPGLWRQELGQLHRGRRPQLRPLSRSARVHGLSRQGQRAEHLRSRRLQLFAGRFRFIST